MKSQVKFTEQTILRERIFAESCFDNGQELPPGLALEVGELRRLKQKAMLVQLNRLLNNCIKYEYGEIK